MFDDYPNLTGLEQSRDWRLLGYFILSGESGPLGRPLSLLSFALQHEAWPECPGCMLTVNMALHAINVIVVYGLTLGLGYLRYGRDSQRSQWLAVCVAVSWGLSPLLATTQLLIIQRMTSLSAFFTFSGLAGYVWAHVLWRHRPRLATFLFVSGLGLGTLLAVLSKENGALLPLLAIVISYSWIPDKERLSSGFWRMLSWMFVILPSALMICYLTYEATHIMHHGYGAGRYFTPYQRVLTELRILWSYIGSLLLPRAADVTPFMDNLPTSTGWLTPIETLISAISWLAVLAISYALRFRLPYIQFGVLFFLVGHILESSFIGLEIYFAHRNYVPAFGIYFAVIASACDAYDRHRRLIPYAVGGYFLLFFIVLWQATQGWSEPAVNAELWVEKNPHSQRAAQFHASSLLMRGDKQGAKMILEKVMNGNPKLVMVRLQRYLTCDPNEVKKPEETKNFIDFLAHAPYDAATALELVRLASGDFKKLCERLDYVQYTKILDALLDNKVYSESKFTRSHLMMAKAYVMAEQGAMNDAIAAFVQAYRLYPNLDTAFIALSMMSNLEQYERIDEMLSEISAYSPSGLLSRILWKEKLDVYRSILYDSRLINERKRLEAPSPA